MSTPAASTARAAGASYAVTMTSGGPEPLRATTSGALPAIARGARAAWEAAIDLSSTVQGTHGSRRHSELYFSRTRRDPSSTAVPPAPVLHRADARAARVG